MRRGSTVVTPTECRGRGEGPNFNKAGVATRVGEQADFRGVAGGILSAPRLGTVYTPRTAARVQ